MVNIYSTFLPSEKIELTHNQRKIIKNEIENKLKTRPSS